MIFFNSWDSIERILIVGVLSYVALIFMLRVTGNRTLSQMNSFDFIITIAMGSTFSSGLLDKQVSLADTVVALGLLILMQFILTKLSVRFEKVDDLIKTSPSMLFLRGEFFSHEMQKERVTKEEIMASIREMGLSTLDQVECVILETNGKLSAIPKQISGTKTLETSKSFNNVSPPLDHH